MTFFLEDRAATRSQTAAPLCHGARDLPKVRVDAYNAELHDPSGEGFLGDRASNRAFVEILEDWRVRVRRGASGQDPLEGALGEKRPTQEINRRELDTLLHAANEDPEAAGLVHSAIEDFAQEMAAVVRRFLRQPAWQGTECIAVGGGFLEARVGLMAIGRVGILLKAGGEPVRMTPVSRHPDEAGLCGAAHLAPPEALHGSDAILAVDIGGTNMRAGLVALDLEGAPDLSRARVAAAERWRHADQKPSRDGAISRLADMLCGLARRAEQEGLRLAPFVGVGCPGVILPDGTIERGGQNLPGGNWEGEGFNLPTALAAALPDLGGCRPLILVHNDAVVQGLSETPTMQDVKCWGVLTIGTGLGNARFSNRSRDRA
jgi:hypothetical protein